jgi:hypothetical protein
VGSTIAILAAFLFLLRYMRRRDKRKQAQAYPHDFPTTAPHPLGTNADKQHIVYNGSKTWQDFSDTHDSTHQSYSELCGARGVHEMPGPTSELPGR